MEAGGGSACEDCGLADNTAGSPSLLLLLPVLLSVLWILFQLFYTPWLLAFLITKLTNLWLTDSAIYIGSIHINLLSSRVVFKHFHYYCRDYSIRVSNGYASVRWCRGARNATPVKKNSFLLIVLDGFEYHWYNRSEVYDNYGVRREASSREVAVETEESGFWQWWKETQPSLHFTINKCWTEVLRLCLDTVHSKGRVVMGNHHLERSLLFQFSKGKARYSTDEASTQYDELMHCVNLRCSNVEVLLEKSHGYTGPVTEQPPTTDEATDETHVLLKSDWADIVFSQDSPGLEPLGQTPPPKYAVDVTLGTNTAINYGCYANRQRRELQSFFFPVDHVEQAISHRPQAGERRVHSMFDISVGLSSAASLQLLFAFQQTSHHLKISLGGGSDLSIHVPWLTDPTGSTSIVKGQLVDISVESSLPYPHLGSAQTISFNVDLHFPRLWNAVQKWQMKFSGTGVQANVLFAYIDFVNALLDDWVGTEPNDLLNFVPVDWSIDVDLANYEIFLFTNRYNWLDLQDVENMRLAFCGSTGHISFAFPFTEFNPPKQLIHFSAKGQDLVVRHYAPPSSANREGLFALSSANRYRWRVVPRPTVPTSSEVADTNTRKQEPSTSQVDSCTSSRPAISLTSTHSDSTSAEKEQIQLLSCSTDSQEHVISAPIIGCVVSDRLGQMGGPEDLNVATPPPQSPCSPEHKQEENTFLDKERFPMGYCGVTMYDKGWLDLACGPTITIDIDYTSHNHDPTAGQHTPLLPNLLHVDIDAPTVLLRVFGCLARDLLGLKENYPGEYIKMSPFNSNSYQSISTGVINTSHLTETPPPQPYEGSHVPEERTIDIFVNFKLRKITAEFPTDLAKEAAMDFPLPSLCTDIFSVQVQYVSSETRVQLHVDPLSVHVPSLSTPSPPTPTYHDIGHLMINSIDFNCHGFTEYLCQERVEYAWMMQLLVGRVTGVVSPLQLLIAGDWFYTTITHTVSFGDGFEVAPDGEVICPRVEPISEEIKYRLFDLDIAEADVYISEAGDLTRLQSAGLDLQMCSFHDNDETMGISWQLQGLTLTGFLPDPQEPTLLLQVGLVDLANLQGSVLSHEPLDCVPERQLQFLKKADQRTQRLWFLWREDLSSVCGCCGGCQFLDTQVSRKGLVSREESAVYAPQFAPLTSVPRHMGFGVLDQTLLSSDVSQLECLQCLHKGLLEHYQARYAPRVPVPARPSTEEYFSSSRALSRPVSGSDDASFVSARSSLTSLLAEDNRSLPEVQVEVTEPVHLKTTRHKRKPSNLSFDVRAGGGTHTDSGDPFALHTDYRDLVGSCFLHSTALHIPHSSVRKHTVAEDTGPQSLTQPQPSAMYKVHHRQSASDTSFMVRSSPDTVAPPSSMFQVYVPCLATDAAGSLPVLTLTAATQTLERRRRIHFRQQQDSSKRQKAKVAVFVQINGANQLLISPPFLKIIADAVNSVETFFSGRSAVSVLNWAMFPASYSVTNQLEQQLPSLAIPSTAPSTLLLHANLTMTPASYLAIQLLQSSSAISATPPDLSDPKIPDKLSEIRAHKSLVTLYTSGMVANFLVRSTTGQQSDSNTGVQPNVGMEPECAAMEGKAVHIAAEVKCPVVQANVAALVEKKMVDEHFPGLVSAQQQLDFTLVTTPTNGRSPDMEVRDLLEAGLKDVGVSVAACVLHSTTTTAPVLTWEALQTPTQPAVSRPAQDVKDNQVYLNLHLPVVWCELASPPCGVPHPSAGGLDILLLQDAASAWQSPVQGVQQKVAALIRSKASRDKQVWLTLFSNAVQSHSLLDKPFNSILARLSVQYRESVMYCCMYQTWRALPMFSEVHIPTLTQTMEEADMQIMALLLALASKIQYVGEDGPLAAPSSPALVGREIDVASLGTAGYISISPSPSIMAMPNRLYESKQYLEQQLNTAIFSQLDYEAMLVIRESLVPLFSAVGVALDENVLHPHLNTAKFTVDFTVQLKDVTFFVLDHVNEGNVVSPAYSTTPTLFAEKLFLNGSVKHNSVQAPPSPRPTASQLLSVKTESPDPLSLAKIAVVSDCCASLDTVHLRVTAPLLKLAKHVSVTGRLRRKASKQARLDQLDQTETPCPPLSAPPVSEDKPSGVVKFAGSVVSHLVNIQGTPAPHVHVQHGTTPSSTHSNVRLVEMAESPRFARKKAQSMPAVPEFKSPHLHVPAGSVPSMGVRYGKMQTSSSEQDDTDQLMMGEAPDGTSPEDVLSTMDTCGEDTTDSQHVISSDNEDLSYKLGTHIAASQPTGMASLVVQDSSDHTLSLLKGLAVPDSQLQFTVFCLLKIHSVKCELQVESVSTVLELSEVSAAVDTRNISPPVAVNTALPLLSELLPTYLSVAAILKKSTLRVSDRGLPDNDLLLLTILPMYASVGFNNNPPITPTYRCLLKLTSLQVDIRQSAIKVHRRFQELMPAFTKIYHDIFGEEVKVVPESYFGAPQSSSVQQVLSVESVMKLPSKLPQGFVHLSLDKLMMYVAPLPSLSVTYTVTPVSMKAQTAQTLSFQLLIGDHMLRFNPKEQHKDELSLRFLALPRLHLQGKVTRARKKALPKVTLELSVRQLNIDVTTDVLNQLLIVQNTFIKELNDLVQMLTSIGESLPSRDRLAAIQRTEEGLDILGLLESCRLSLAGIIITVSTPLATAIRFSTGKIEMTVSSQQWPWKTGSAMNQLSLDGRVEIDVNLALGYLHDTGPDVVDDLKELAYFKTRISIRNTLQKLPEDSVGGFAAAVDTFLISIISPHLYLQSSAVEQAILFWLNCKSVYSYWQNERKLLNVEIRRATDAFIQKIPHPSHFQTPSIDFTKPRLVQISVTDVGACMPIIPVSSAQHTTQKPFPALVVTIKDMHFVLNLSHKVASTGRFQTFCIRFAEQFSIRHKIWTLDPKRHKLTNFGTITRGTFRLCIATKKRYCHDSAAVVGEKLLCGFQWDMSGIDVHANTDIGRHTSTLVRTLVTTIASDSADGQEKQQRLRSSSTNLPSPKSQSTRHVRRMSSAMHKRSASVYQRPSQADTNYKTVLEQQLAKQTRRVQQLRYSGANGDNLRVEEAILRSTEQELAKTVQRMFRHPRTGLTLQTFNQLFSPRQVTPSHERSGSVHRLSTAVRSKLFSLSESRDKDSLPASPVHAAGTRPLGHRRYKSDLTGIRADSPAPSPLAGGDGEDELLEEREDTFEDTMGEAGAEPAKELEGFSLPSIDLEFDVTVNVDDGKIVLRTEESFDQSFSHSTLLTHSPLLRSRSKSERKHSVESVVLIPALTIKTHYQSIVGPNYSHLSTTPQRETTPTSSPVLAGKPDIPQPVPHFPVKKGVLSLSVIIESLPDDIRLTHSFLEFIEQVARPTLAATVVSSSSSESLEEEAEATAATEDKSNQSLSISFPVDVILTFHIQPSTVFLTCQPHSNVECIIQSPDVNFVISFSLFSQQLWEGSASLGSSSPAGSISGPNANIVPFNNLFITGCLTTFVLQLYSRKPGGVATDTTKEALSLTLGQALVHLSRKSVSAPFFPKGSSRPAASVDDYASHNKMQVSVITNVASLVLGYDMRRLNDITAFKRYWYRTSLVEAIFIGSKKTPEDDSLSSTLALDSSAGQGDVTSAVLSLDNTVSAAIVVAASIDDFRVSANVAQVMGNADLLISCLKCEAHCDVSHNELVLLQLKAKLDKGEFDARAGIIAGSILMEDATVEVTTQSQHGSIPEHRGKAALPLVEGKVEYMSAHVLLGRATNLEVEVSDVWQGLCLDVDPEVEPEQAYIQVEATFRWQDMQLAIHRSTTQHLINIVEKMYDFFMQQKRRSERTLSNMLPAGSAASKALQAYRKEQEQQRIAEKEESAISEDYSHHHWLWAVKVGGVELMRILGIQTPKDAEHEVSLGGNIRMSGESVCIVCFHGPSFRETERAVFSIDQVAVSFATQAIPGLLSRWHAEMTGKTSPGLQTHLRTCQQIVELQLGSEGRSQELASIHRVFSGRSRVPNIVGVTIKDWLVYACIDTFLHEEKYISDTSTLVRLSRKLSIQPVLLVPALHVKLINDHSWPIRNDQQLLPRVECTLTSSFADGISVTTTVDHYLFLHDLVKGYIDYLQKHRIKPSEQPPQEYGSPSTPPLMTYKRQFECVHWELNPHLRLLSTVSGQFNPHISWLLEKLGFSDAQTTIPKWIQRGAMDPLDKVVSTVVELLVKLTASKKEKLVSSSISPSHPIQHVQ